MSAKKETELREWLKGKFTYSCEQAVNWERTDDTRKFFLAEAFGFMEVLQYMGWWP